MTSRSFTRVRFTWLAYFMLAFYVYLQALVGLLVPFLRAKLDLSYSVGALHISAFAVGLIVSGLSGERLTRRWGRHAAFWSGGAGMALGAWAVTLGSHVAVTLCGAFVMGLCGSLVLMNLQAGLSDQHGEQRTVALAEANVGASLCAMLAPIVLGASMHVGLDWASTSFLAAAAFVLLNIRFYRLPIPTAPSTVVRTTADDQPLPLIYWAYWTVLFIGIAIEWCMVAWSADFLKRVSGLGTTSAATMVSVFFLAMMLGRAGGGGLSRIYSSMHLLLATVGITGVGFAIFWLAAAPLNIVGLFITGLGVASFYPLSVSLALSAAPGQTDRANARIVLGMGTAILTIPLIMGWAADQFSIQQAFGIVGGLVGGAGVIAYMTNQRARSQPAEQLPALETNIAHHEALV